MSEIEKAKKLFDKWFRGGRAAQEERTPESQEPQPPQPEEGEVGEGLPVPEDFATPDSGDPGEPAERWTDSGSLETETPDQPRSRLPGFAAGGDDEKEVAAQGDSLHEDAQSVEPPADLAEPPPSEPSPVPPAADVPVPPPPANLGQPTLIEGEVPRVPPAPPAKAVESVAAEEPAAAPEAAGKANWFQRLRAGLTRSSNALSDSLTGVLRRRKLDDETLQDLEDVLIQADLGVETAMRITEALAESRYDKEITAEEVRDVLGSEVERVLAPVAKPLRIDRARKPHVILVVGVNGSGKTTTIGKLAARFRREGLSVVLGAGDTFRAAAIEQLKVWGGRAGAEVVAREQGADASGLAYDALARSKEANADLLILDTAGRLQNKAHLMAELEKIVRVLRKQDESAPHEVLLVLDATTGQNAMQQVDVFKQVCGVTGLAMTKLDGTARGGILVAIAAKHALPVHFIGVGEGVDDLQPFEAADFARAIAGRTT